MPNCAICDALLVESFEKDPPKCGECWKREAIALRAEIKRLYEALDEYAEHTKDCPFGTEVDVADGMCRVRTDCTCGLNAALSPRKEE